MVSWRIGVVLGALVATACAPSDKREFLLELGERSVAAGFSRTDRATRETITAENLARNFRRVAFNFEDEAFGPEGSGGLSRPDLIRRWPSEIPFSFMGPPPALESVKERTAQVMERLSRNTGTRFIKTKPRSQRRKDGLVPRLFIMAADQAWFDAVVADYEAGAFEGTTSRIAESVKSWHEFRGSPCGGVMFSPDKGDEAGVILAAVIFIRTDLSARWIESCLEEELAQVMGLPNDHPDVSPSVFNDDEEYALLTRHDELLLKILYDQRLAPGMPPDRAMPLVREIARELVSDAPILAVAQIESLSRAGLLSLAKVSE